MASKNTIEEPIEEPVAASKTTEVQTAAEHRANVIQHLNNGDSQAAFEALMTNHITGQRMDYSESRMMYG